jgi:hypothetical protein
MSAPKSRVRLANRATALVASLIAASVFFTVIWSKFPGFRPLLVVLAAALGTMSAALAGFSSTIYGKMVPASLASILVALGTWFTTFQLDDERKAFQTRLTFFQEAFVDAANGLPDGERSDLILKVAKILSTQTGQNHFDHVDDLSAFVLKIAPENGHGLYFSGEASRIRSFYERASLAAIDREHMRGQFDRYLSVEATLPPDQRNAAAKACYERPLGFCAERTAWINNLMANDFFDQFLKTSDQQRAISALKSSCNYLNASLSLVKQLANPEDKMPPEGFHQYPSLQSTQDLHDRLKKELAARGEQPCP